MRQKQIEQDLLDRFVSHGLGLPSNYSLVALTDDVENVPLLKDLNSRLYPAGVRQDQDTIEAWLNDPSAVGFLMFNTDYKQNGSLVGAIVINYSEEYDLAILESRLAQPLSSRRRHTISDPDILDVDEDDYDLETAAIIMAGVLPGDSLSSEIKDMLMKLAIATAKESCFFDVVYPIWEKDPMLQTLGDFGFVEIGNEPQDYANGDKQIVLKKDAISTAEHVNNLASLTGEEWFFTTYLRGKK